MFPLINKIVRKLRRAALPKAYRHMADYDRRLSLVGNGEQGAHRIFWKDQEIGLAGNPADVRGKYRGDCFIVCSGPSLNEVDLRAIAAYPCMAVNGSLLKFQEQGLQPDFYTAADRDFFEHHHPLIERALSSPTTCFFSLHGLSTFAAQHRDCLPGRTIYLSETANRLYGKPRRAPSDCNDQTSSDAELLAPPQGFDPRGIVGFSSNLAKGIFCGRTIAFQALQIAYHLGFRRIFLVGMDLGGTGPLRCYDEPRGQRPSLLEKEYEEYILPAFEIVSRHRQQLELEVYNLSTHSRLPHSVIPKMDWLTALELIGRESARCA